MNRWREGVACIPGGAGALLGLLLVLPGCRGGEAPATPSAAQGPTARRYTVRGEVVRLPAPASRDGELFVRHEPIDDFVDGSGRVVGMASMTMPFPVAPGAFAGQLAVGDKIEFRFLVDWAGPAFKIEHIDLLPAATQLRFGPTTPR